MPKVKNNSAFTIHVVPGTHWDREWRYSFEETRQRLIRMLDNVIETLEKNKKIPAFELDGQFLPVENYLEFRPEYASKLKKLVKAGRIHIGPWYCLPDMCSILGESVVRNLLTGITLCREFGGVSMEGMTNSSWGQISQMPQIMTGFGIDTYLSYHGVPGHLTKVEFWWEGPDGSKILFIRAPKMTKSGFFICEWRAFPPEPSQSMSVPAGSELLENAYRLADKPMVDDSPFYGDDTARKPNMEVFAREFFDISGKLKTETATPNILMGELNDAQWMAPNIDKLVAQMQKLDPNGDTIRLSSIPDYFNSIKRTMGRLETFKGEMRFPFKEGFAFRLCNVLSTRLYLKQLNRQAEYLLGAWTEPFSCFASMLGAKYPSMQIFDAWKMLLLNQSHDNIGGCSVDHVHEDMIWRYRQIMERSRAILHRSLGEIARKIGSKPLEKNQSRLITFNPLAMNRSGSWNFFIDVPLGIECNDVEVRDKSGKVVESAVLGTSMDKSAPLELQLSGCPAVPIKRYNIEVRTDNLPSVGYSEFTLTALPEAKPKSKPMPCGQNWMENENLRVDFNPDGTVNLSDKRTGQKFENLHWFEDCGQDRAARISWYTIHPAQDKIYDSRGRKAKISLVHSSALSAKMEVEYTFAIPKGLDLNDVKMVKQEHFTSYRYQRRSDELIEMKITSVFTLNAGAKRLDVETKLDNQATDHRLRVMFPTRISTDSSYADSAFDIVKRPIAKFNPDDYLELKGQGDVQTCPMLRFTDLASESRSLAIIGNGMPEYDVVGEDNTIALTLLRAIFHGRIDPETQMMQVNSSQCLGRQKYQYAIYPHSGTWNEACVFEEALDHNIPPIGVQCLGAGTGELPDSASLLNFSKPGLVISAFKKANSGNGYVLRVFNPSERRIESTVTLNTAKIASVKMCNMLEEEIRGSQLKIDKSGGFKISAGAKKVVTVLIKIK